MPHQEFIETYSLYRKLKNDIPEWVSDLAQPSIHLPCELCDSDQTFVVVNNYDIEHFGNRRTSELLFRVVYKCAACQTFKREFFLKIDEPSESIMKVGQFPSWEIAMDKNLAALLGEHSDFYKKGLVCESQAYGIGAYAYYRRIVETIIDQLLESVTDLIPETEKPRYLAALQKTKQTIVAKEKIEMVKDLLPEILRPSGQNPLGLLHDFLSGGLHAGSEEECLENAQHIREVLVFLVNQIIRSKSSSKQFTDSMRKLLDKKSATASQVKK